MWKFTMACGVLAFASSAQARNLQCNKAQTTCVTESTRLGIGDRVGVFNEDGELVATGEVSGMRGQKRSVIIANRHGTIAKDDRIALLENPMIDGRVNPVHKHYREPNKAEVGGALGYSTITLGSSTPGLEATGYAQWRRWGNVLLIGRGVYHTASGQTTVAGASKAVAVNGLGLLGGVGYEWFATSPLSLRAEGAVGGMHMTAAVGGDKTPVDNGEADIQVKNGAAFYGRWSIGGVYHVNEDWHFHADVVQSLVYQAFANTLSLGMARNLD